jgi:hypothetical protein
LRALIHEGRLLRQGAARSNVAQDIRVLRLDDEAITANGPHVLAFDNGID